jgi:hypothetical protein
LQPRNRLGWNDWGVSIIYWRELVGVVRGILDAKSCVRICIPEIEGGGADGRDCGVYFKRMRAAGSLMRRRRISRGLLRHRRWTGDTGYP